MNAATGDVWRSRRAVFVQNPALDHGCACQARFFSNNKGQASVSLQYATNVAGVNNNPRHIILSLLPPNIESCEIVEDVSVPPYLLKYIPTSIASPSDDLTVAFVLGSPGAVHHPKGLTRVRPVDPGNIELQAFVEVCQATVLYLHFAKAQFEHHDKIRLQRLIDGLHKGDLRAPPLNLDREDRGRGLQEGTWQVFSLEASKVSHQEQPQVLGKRNRRASVSSSDEPLKRAAAHNYTTPPPYSPTQVNTSTPATRSANSNYIRPTVFTLPPYCKEDPKSFGSDAQVSLLASMLATVPEHVLREAIVQSGHAHLLGTTGTTLDKHESRSERISSPAFRAIVKDLFTSELETRLKFLVESGLPLHIKGTIETIMDEYHNQFHVDCQAAEAAIQEKVDDASLEVKMALEDGMKEIEELIEEHIQRLASEHEAIDGKAELELENLRSWFVKFAHTLLFERRLDQESGRALDRCTSV